MKNYNHGLAEKQFKKDWNRQKAEYFNAGMSEEMILQMYEYEREVFNSDRRYLEHYEDAEFLLDSSSDNSEMDAKNAKKREKYLDVISEPMPESDRDSALGWINEIESNELSQIISSLNKEEIALLTLYAMNEMSIAEIARVKNVAKQTIWKKIERIKKKFKKSHN